MQLFILMKQDVRNILTNPTIVLFCLVYPIVLVLLFGFLFSDLYQGNVVTSYDFYGVTMMFYLILASSTITPTVFMEERTKKANMRIAYAPVSRVQIYVSKLVTTFLFLACSFLLHILLLNGTGLVNFGGDYFPFVLLLLTSLLAFTVTLGGAVCTLIKSEDWTNKIVGVTMNTLAIFSGIFFPIATLGKFAEAVASKIPVKMILDTIFQLIYDQSMQNYGITMIIAISCTIFFLWVIHKNYHIEDYI